MERTSTLLFAVCLAVIFCPVKTSAVEFESLAVGSNRVTVCRIDVRKEHLQLFHRDDTGAPFKRFDRLASWLEPRGKKLVFAINAGMYHENLSAVGLSVADGKELTALNTSDGKGNFFLKPNGVFLISEKGASIVDTTAYPDLHEHALLATQSGPLLVHDGKIRPDFKPGSASRSVRDGVGVVSRDMVVFAICETPVNLYEMAALFRDTLHCHEALYLDGHTASLHSMALKRSDSKEDLGPIIALVE